MKRLLTIPVMFPVITPGDMRVVRRFSNECVYTISVDINYLRISPVFEQLLEALIKIQRRFQRVNHERVVLTQVRALLCAMRRYPALVTI